MLEQIAPEFILIRSATIWSDDVNQIVEWKIESWCRDSLSGGAWLEITFSTFDSDQMGELTQFLTSLLMDPLVNNMKTVYRESEDRFPGIERTRDYRKGKFP